MSEFKASEKVADTVGYQSELGCPKRDGVWKDTLNVHMRQLRCYVLSNTDRMSVKFKVATAANRCYQDFHISRDAANSVIIRWDQNYAIDVWEDQGISTEASGPGDPHSGPQYLI